MEIPEGWTEKTINDVLSKKTDTVDVQANDEYHQIGIRSHGKGIFYKEPVSGLSLGNKRIFWIHPDCFIVNIVFGWEQAVAVTSREEVGMVASHRFPMYLPKNNGCDVEYIEYFFKTKYGKYLLELASPGGAGRNKTLGQKSFLEIPLVLPSLKEQQKIVKILKTWDRAIMACEALIDQSEAQKKSLMQQLLTGKRRLPGYEGEWQEVRLGDLCQIRTGKRDANHGSEDGEYLFFTCSKKTKRIDNYSFDTEAILIAGNGDVGHCRYYKGKFDAYQRTYVLDGFKNVNPTFCFLVLQTFFEPKVQAKKQMGAMPYIKVGALKSFDFLLPLITEQSAVANMLLLSVREIEILQNKLQTLKTEKAALMQQLLTGKRRVQLTEAA